MPCLSTRATLAALAILLTGTRVTHAQAAVLGQGAAYVSAGVGRISTGDLDTQLRNAGYPTLGSVVRGAGVGAYRVFAHAVMVGGEINGVGTGERSTASVADDIAGGYATIGIGRMRHLSSRARWYPRFGVGAGGVTVELDDKQAAINFDDVLRDPAVVDRNTQGMTRAGFVLDLGGGLEWLMRDTSAGPVLGVRAGYLITSFGRDWESSGRSITGGPRASLTGPYIRLSIGASWPR